MKIRKQRIAGQSRSKVMDIVPMQLAAAGPAQLPELTLKGDLVPYAQEHAEVDIDITDPYEIAYLRGGEKEVLKLILFDLVEQGYLEIRETSKLIWTTRQLAISADHPPLERLTKANRELMGWFAKPRGAAEIFQMPIPEGLASTCIEYQRRLRQSGLLSEHSDRALRIQRAVSGLIVFVIAVIFMFVLPALLAFLATIGASILVYHYSSPERLTAKGKRRLKELEAQYVHLKSRPKTARTHVHDPALVLSVAVFGAAVLADSVYDAFAAAASDGPPDGGGDDGGDGCGGCGCGCG